MSRSSKIDAVAIVVDINDIFWEFVMIGELE
jgi:hypothetical protein